MKKIISRLGLACALAFTSAATLATPLLSLVPQVNKIHPPQNLLVDVVISGLQSGGTNSLLGAFDLKINFDPLLLQFLQIGSSLGTGLGDATDPAQTLIGGDSSVPGVFEFFEVSLLASLDLASLQSDSFSLASLLFYAPGTSASPTGFTQISIDTGSSILGDDNGDPIAFTVQNANVAIPEPTGHVLALTALSVALLFGRGKRRTKNSILA